MISGDFSRPREGILRSRGRPARSDQNVDVFESETRQFEGGPGSAEEGQGCAQADFIVGSNGKQASDELLEKRVVASVFQFEKHRFGIFRHGFSDAAEHGSDRIGTLRFHGATLAKGWGRSE